MSEQRIRIKTYLQKKNEESANRARMLNLVKQIALALFAVFGYLRCHGDTSWWYGEGEQTKFLAILVRILVKPYVSLPLLAVSIVLTLLWNRSQRLLVAHGIVFAPLGLALYMSWWPLIITDVGLIAWPFIATFLWAVTLVLFACAWNGNRIVEVEEVEGLESIFPEEREQSE